eukprot:g43634.t1
MSPTNDTYAPAETTPIASTTSSNHYNANLYPSASVFDANKPFPISTLRPILQHHLEQILFSPIENKIRKSLNITIPLFDDRLLSLNLNQIFNNHLHQLSLPPNIIEYLNKYHLSIRFNYSPIAALTFHNHKATATLSHQSIQTILNKPCPCDTPVYQQYIHSIIMYAPPTGPSSTIQTSSKPCSSVPNFISSAAPSTLPSGALPSTTLYSTTYNTNFLSQLCNKFRVDKASLYPWLTAIVDDLILKLLQ